MRDARVLVVEDEFLVAADLEDTLTALGYQVLGPFPTLAEALSWLDSDKPDAAVLDVNIRGELIFPVAERLTELGVPFVFCTGYADIGVIPDTLEPVATLSKPCTPATLARALGEKLSPPDAVQRVQRLSSPT
jgi:two-component SAPR family response regulator